MIYFVLIVVASIIIISIIFRKIFIEGRKCPKELKEKDLDGKTILITGSSDGIGLTVATLYAKQHANIIFACRNEAKTKKVIESIKKSLGRKKCGNLVFHKLDLSDFESVKSFCRNVNASFSVIDVIICNAGVNTGVMNEGQRSKQGYELCFAVNHLGHFLMIYLLMDIIKKSNSRILVTSSRYYEFCKREDFQESYKMQVDCVYARSKLCNILFTRYLQKNILDRLKSTENDPIPTAFSIHPGLVRTKIFRTSLPIFYVLTRLIWYFMSTTEESAQTFLYLGLREDFMKSRGKHFSDCKESKVNSLVKDETLQSKVWEFAEKCCGIEFK